MKRVLLAEDDEANRMMLTRVLEKRGFAVCGASNGVEVFEKLSDARARNEPYDVLLLDWMMPVLSGIEALPGLRKSEPTLPIIMLTARNGRDDVLGAFERGADDYVTKPFDFDVLIARLDARFRTVRRAPERAIGEPDTGFIIDGRYKLIEQIGSGAFGLVYRARHLTLETDVAVKMLKAEVALPQTAPLSPIDSRGNPVSKPPGKDAAEEFRREGVRACRVNHENAVRIFDFGVLPSGRAYLVMELLRGRTLDDEFRANRRLSLLRAVEILRPVLECLVAAHAQSVVHRDIKPANIFLHQSARGEVVKVLDFGVAKLLEVDGDITRDIVPGSPSYMAPERLRGEKYDGRSDVYSLGVTLYELLTGDVPFRSESREVFAIALKHLRDEAVPPSSVVDGLPPAVDDVMRALLAKNPADRPSALEAAAMLKDLVAPAVAIEVTDGFDEDASFATPSISEASGEVLPSQASPSEAAPREVALVVDDDPVTQALIARALREQNVEAVAFGDAERALANWNIVKPTFVLLDVALPGMNGIDLARHITSRDELRSTPVLVMSAALGALGQGHERDAMELGACFISKPFRLPVFNEAMRELRVEATRRRGERRKPRVLIVDDDDGIRDALRGVVRDEGYEALCAADAFEALSLCGATAPTPDVAIIDVMLPGLDGPGLAARFKATKHLGSVPIVMISAFDSLPTHAARVGARATLKKPFDLGVFIDLVRRTVDDSLREEAR